MIPMEKWNRRLSKHRTITSTGSAARQSSRLIRIGMNIIMPLSLSKFFIHIYLKDDDPIYYTSWNRTSGVYGATVGSIELSKDYSGS